MSISEYGQGIYRDFFQADGNLAFSFPCSACKFRFGGQDEEPCQYCDHNTNAEKSFFCACCQDHTPGDPEDDQHHLASRTPAHVGPVCLTCKNTILKERDDVTCDACGAKIEGECRQAV